MAMKGDDPSDNFLPSKESIPAVRPSRTVGRPLC